MDNFRNYYINSIIPQLKKIEEERKSLEKKITTITILYAIVLTIVAAFLIYFTHNLNFISLYISIPVPATFFLKDLIGTYSKKYKETVIKNLFLSYFDHYEIDTQRRVKFGKIKGTGLFSFTRNIEMDSEDYITVTHNGDKVDIREILLKETRRNRKIIFFKGILCSMDLKRDINQTIIFRNQESIDKGIEIDSDLKTLDINNIRVYYQETFDQELFKPLIDFSANNQLFISISDRKLNCIIPADGLFFNDSLDEFEPALASKYNSNFTYTLIRNEYYRIRKYSKIILNLETLNIA
jgi:hypothetical protein